MDTRSAMARFRSSRLAASAGTLLLKIVVPLAVLVAAGMGGKAIIDSAPEAPRRTPQRQALLVQVQPAEAVDAPVVVEAMGSVKPARAVQLKPQVSGRVEWIARLEPGARFAEGEALVRIEATDYELAVRQRQSDVRVQESMVIEAQRRLTYAEQDLKMEMGSQSIAQREYELLEEELDGQDPSLVLRQPQLLAAEAEVEAGKAAVSSARAALEASAARLEAARLDLARTTVTSPFNVVVDEKLVEAGDVVTPSAPLVRLVGSDAFWIELAVQQRDLGWIAVPQGSDGAGSIVRVFNDAAWPAQSHRTGRVIRRLPGVDPQGRMARVLVQIDDPLALNGAADQPPLLIGSYVRAEIVGPSPGSRTVLPRRLLRNEDEVWIMQADGALEIRRVQVLHRQRDTVLIGDGLAPGELVVISEIASPVAGMPLRVADIDVPPLEPVAGAIADPAPGAERLPEPPS